MEFITFSGASDDLVHVRGPITAYDEVSPTTRNSNGDLVEEARFVVTQGHTAVRVTVSYDGVWAVKVEQVHEDNALPEGMTITQCPMCAYSSQLNIPYLPGTIIVREV